MLQSHLLKLSVLAGVLCVSQVTDGLGGPFGLGLQTSHLPTHKPLSIRGRLSRKTALKKKMVGRSPQLLETPDSGAAIQWGVEGEWKEIACGVRAHPEAKFSWKLNGIDVEAKEGRYEISRPQKNWSVLRVFLTDETKGEYTCRGHNPLGAVEKNIRVDIAEPPPHPKFICDSVPDEESILCQVVNLTEGKRVWTVSFLDSSELLRVQESMANSFDMGKKKSTRRRSLERDKFFLWRSTSSRFESSGVVTLGGTSQAETNQLWWEACREDWLIEFEWQPKLRQDLGHSPDPKLFPICKTE